MSVIDYQDNFLNSQTKEVMGKKKLKEKKGKGRQAHFMAYIFV